MVTLQIACLFGLAMRTRVTDKKPTIPGSALERNFQAGVHALAKKVTLAIVRCPVHRLSYIHPRRKERQLAKPNYDFAKRQKELAKKAKKEEKRLRKLAAGETPESADAEDSTDADDAPADENKPAPAV